MTPTRRKELARAAKLIDQALDIVNAAINAEQDAYSALSERQRDGDRGEAMQEAIDEMEDASSNIEGAMAALSALAEGE